MPPLTDITFNPADGDGYGGNNGLPLLAEIAAAGEGTLSVSIGGSAPSGPLALVADTFPPLSTEDLHGYRLSDAIGSLTPNEYGGQTIGIILSGLDRFGNDICQIQINATGLAQSFFASIEINGVTRTSATASFTDTGAECIWSWSGLDGFPAWFFVDGSYTVTIS